MNLPPDGPIALHREPGFVGRVEADDVEAAARRALGTVGRVHAVPDRRMRLLHGLELHRNVAEGKSPAFEVEDFLGQPLDYQLNCFRVDLFRLLWVRALIFELDRPRTTPLAQLQP